MSKVENIKFEEALDSFKRELEMVEDAIIDNSRSDVVLIPTVSGYLTKNGGKRIRPLLLLAASRLCGYNNGNRHVTYSCIVEFIHVATLLHDDVVDNAKTRRGKKTVNLEWGNKASVLVADYLFAKSFLLMAEDKNSKIINFMSKTTKEIVEGETLEWLNSNRLDITEQQYLEIINRKTAVLISACCRIGSVLGGATEKEEHAMLRFGENVGMAFQLIDDMLDYFGDEAKLGKQVGNDLKQGNVTLPLIHLYHNAADNDKKRIESIIRSDDITKDDFAEILLLMKNYNSREYTLNKSKEYLDDAKSYLECFKSSEFVSAIHSIADYVIQRDI